MCLEWLEEYLSVSTCHFSKFPGLQRVLPCTLTKIYGAKPRSILEKACTFPLISADRLLGTGMPKDFIEFVRLCVHLRSENNAK